MKRSFNRIVFLIAALFWTSSALADGLTDFLAGGEVQYGFVRIDGVGTEVASLQGEFVAVGPDSLHATERVHFSVYGRRFDGGFAYAVGQFRTISDTVTRSTTRAVDLGSASYHRAFVIDRGRDIALLIDLNVIANIMAGTQTDIRHLRAIDDELTFCSSEAAVSVRTGIRFEQILTVELEAALRGDPLHFGFGLGCIGGGDLWRSGESLSLTGNLRLAEGIRLNGFAGVRSARLWARASDRGHHKDAFVFETEEWLAGLTLSVDFNSVLR